MGWLQKRPQFQNPASLSYQVSLNKKSILLVGLGNYPKKYQGTRHNIGFDALDYLVSSITDFGSWSSKKDFKCDLAIGQISDKRVIAMKPTTLMNNSGQAVSAVLAFYKLKPSDVLVIYDDLDINFGQIRIRGGGSSAGHNGVKSIIESLKSEDFKRLRIGIKNSETSQLDAKDFVLQKFNIKEQKNLKALNNEVASLITEYLSGNGELNNETRSFIF